MFMCVFGAIAVLVTMFERRASAATAKDIDMSVLRVRLPISRRERRDAVQGSLGRTELDCRQNHAEFHRCNFLLHRSPRAD